MVVVRPHTALFLGTALASAACSAVPVSVGALARDAEATAPDGHDASAPSDAHDAGAALDAGASLYLEAEQGALSGGFYVVDAPDASAGQALAPPDDSAADDAPGAARARYELLLPRNGVYVIWGRIHSPDAGHNRFWFALDGEPFRKWRISVGDVWYWDDLHDDFDYGHALHFSLSAGSHVLELAPAVPGALLDRLYVTAEGDVPPGNDTPCSPPHSIELLGTCHASCGAQNGRACGSDACAGRVLIEAYDCGVCCLVP